MNIPENVDADIVREVLRVFVEKYSVAISSELTEFLCGAIATLQMRDVTHWRDGLKSRMRVQRRMHGRVLRLEAALNELFESGIIGEKGLYVDKVFFGNGKDYMCIDMFLGEVILFMHYSEDGRVRIISRAADGCGYIENTIIGSQ